MQLTRQAALTLALAALALTAGPASAQPLVMNFNGQTVSRTPAPTTFTQDGIRLVATVAGGNTLFNAGNPDPGYALNTTDAATATFTLTGGGTFTANAIDVNVQTQNFSLLFTGTLPGGGTVADTFATGSNGHFQTYTPPATFADLTSFKLTDPGGRGSSSSTT